MTDLESYVSRNNPTRKGWVRRLVPRLLAAGRWLACMILVACMLYFPFAWAITKPDVPFYLRIAAWIVVWFSFDIYPLRSSRNEKPHATGPAGKES